MRQNTMKPRSSIHSRHNIWSSSIRDIIGDRRFKAQFSPKNTHETEAEAVFLLIGRKKVKTMKVGDPEACDIPNLGQNASSVQCEAEEAPRRCCVDVAAKTAEYAFFKRMKENTSSNICVHPKYHDNQLNNVQPSDHLAREIPNVKKECGKYARSTLPVEKQQDDAYYSFLSPQCDGSKNSETNNAFGLACTDFQNVKPGEYNWLSPSIGCKSNNSGNKGVFAAKREKLRQWVADKSLSEVDELHSKRFDLVSVLLSRILPEDKENNCNRDSTPCHVETDSKNELPSFPELEAATLIKGRQAHKRKSIATHYISYLDDGFSRATTRLNDTDLLEWHPIGSGSLRQAAEANIQYNCSDTDSLRIPNFAIESISSSDKPLPRYGSGNLIDLDEFHVHNKPNLIEQPRTLLLGWEPDIEKDELEPSALDSNAFSTSPTPWHDDHHLFLPNTLTSTSPSSFNTCPNSPLSPHHHLDSIVTPPHIGRLTLPYTPKHLKPVELPQDHTWCLNESSNEKEHCGLESFLFLIPSPANDLLRFLHTRSLHSFLHEENKEDFLYSPNHFSEGRVKRYIERSHNQDFVHLGYPFRDSSRDDGYDDEWIYT